MKKSQRGYPHRHPLPPEGVGLQAAPLQARLLNVLWDMTCAAGRAGGRLHTGLA